MHTRTLGGLTVSAIGLGSLALTGGYGAVDEPTAIGTVRRALDLGVTLLDTADFYRGGELERLLGKAIAGRRDEAVLATRGGAVFTDGSRPTEFNGTPSFLRQACDESLRRLGVDHIDLYYLARPDPRVPIEESVGALAALVDAGKVRHIGLSEVPAELLYRAQRVHPIAALQSGYSLWERGIEAEILPAARELGVGFVAHSPLGRGFLTGTLPGAEQLAPGDYRRRQPRFGAGSLARQRLQLVPAERMAGRCGITPAQLALAWLLAQGEDIVPIPGTRTAAHLAENADAAAVSLAPGEVKELAGLFATGG
jgi:aryl-alcohol dehydrogenase-like predicted oxidoreductase